MKECQNMQIDFGSLFMKYVGEAVSRAVEEGITRAMQNYVPKQVVSETPKYYSRKDVADILHISYPTLHGLMKKNAIKFIKVGKKTLFPQAELDEMVASGELRKYRRTH